MKNFFQNSPYDEEGAQKLFNNKSVFGKTEHSEGGSPENKAFVPFFGENFFNEKSEEKKEKKSSKPFMQKRLNDFDGNILRESAIFNFDDKDMRLEEKIKLAQELLKSYKEKISIMEISGNSEVKNKLVSQKEDLEGILSNLNLELKNNSGFGENISLKLNEEKNILKQKISKLKEICENKMRPYDFLYKFFPRVYQTKILKDSLKKLRRINALAHELAQSQTPYGEGDIKYKSMIAYLSSAGALHAKLRKQIGN